MNDFFIKLEDINNELEKTFYCTLFKKGENFISLKFPTSIIKKETIKEISEIANKYGFVDWEIHFWFDNQWDEENLQIRFFSQDFIEQLIEATVAKEIKWRNSFFAFYTSFDDKKIRYDTNGIFVNDKLIGKNKKLNNLIWKTLRTK